LLLQAERETRKFFQDHYFLTDPDKFIFEFFPIEEGEKEWYICIVYNKFDAKLRLVLKNNFLVSNNIILFFRLAINGETNFTTGV
jgi:hypothetical protein